MQPEEKCGGCRFFVPKEAESTYGECAGMDLTQAL